MANIQERRNKDGKLISYSIRIARGYGADGKQLKPYTETFRIQPTWSEKTARKKAEAYAAAKEKEVKEGRATDCRQTFQSYCEYVINLKEQRGCAHSTVTRYRSLAKRIYPQIGHIKLSELRVDHINDLYTYLSADGMNERTGGKLSSTTVHRYHELISTVLTQAMKERRIVFNAAQLSEKPKTAQKEVNYFTPEEVARILEAANSEPIKWRAMLHLFAATGARRSEIVGLKWASIDFENNTIDIKIGALYSPDWGIYTKDPKTEKSKRAICLPQETMNILKAHKKAQAEEMLKLGAYYSRQGYVFTQDNGKPIHPDSFYQWAKKFSKRHDLPHINPHAFRHTAASLLIHNGVDIVDVSKHLGHAKVSTTADIYAHVFEEDSKKRNAAVIAEALYKHA